MKRVHIVRERNVCCDVEGCQYTTYTKQLLNAHKLGVHINYRPIGCSFDGCDKRFKNNNHLALHMSTVHKTNTIRFECKQEGCGQWFGHPSGLKRHNQRFHSTRVYRCDWPGCDYTAKLPSNLKSHSYSHRTLREFVCSWPACGKAFKSPKTMEQHLTMHKNDKKYACKWSGCLYRCYASSNVKKHERMVHKMVHDN